jgi:integrase
MLKRRPFTEDELLRVFGSKAFVTQRDTNAARYWIPVLCLFNICRREEASQLSVADIQGEHGIPFLSLKKDALLKQTLKNDGSHRRVPIHTSLIKLGFLDHMQTMRKPVTSD